MSDAPAQRSMEEVLADNERLRKIVEELETSLLRQIIKHGY